MKRPKQQRVVRRTPLRICVLPGDGIGAEVMALALPVLDVVKIEHELRFARIGWECWRSEGNPVPSVTWDSIKSTDVTLLGAVTSKPLREAEEELPDRLKGQNRPFVSPVIQLRQKLNLYANVRPIFDVSGDDRYRFVVIRENTEGLYAGLDFASIPVEFEPLLNQREAQGAPWTRSSDRDASMAVRLQTKAGLRRLFRFAFDYAVENSFDRVTWADKPNVLRHSGAFARDCLEEVAPDYPNITWSIENIDAIALWMVRRPERFGVIVAENMFGDILSDLGAGIMGGLGLAPSANIGEHGAYFEPVHGSAPPYVGLDKANPSAMFLTIALMLRHTGFAEEALMIEAGVVETARSCHRTYDLGGDSTSKEVAQAILQAIRRKCAIPPSLPTSQDAGTRESIKKEIKA